MNSLVWADISLAALKNNLQIAKSAAPNCQLMAVVKSNGYGHGMIAVAQALTNIDAFAVARIDEAIELRTNSIKHPIIVLSGILTHQDIIACIKHDLQAVIHSDASINALKETTISTSLNIWLKLDTGMHRLGLNSDKLSTILALVESNSNLHCQGILSHLCEAEKIHSKKNRQQKKSFEESLPDTSYPTSMVNSAGVLFHPAMHYNWIRPGLMLYGINPADEANEFTQQLQPAMTLKSKVLSVRSIPSGESVGYNSQWTAERPSQIATIAIGYGDGYPRHCKNGTPVLIAGNRYPLAGRVSMDMITVDVTGSSVQAGDEVTLWGKDLCVKEIAESAGTIAYQLLTGITPRVQRFY